MEHSDWHDLIKKELPENYYIRIHQFMDKVYEEERIFPPRDKVFRALQLTSYEKTKVVILGQDPYHGLGQAQGLSFSVPDDTQAPPSLQNILKELRDDIGERQNHDLTSWAEQGVLLLNACLTVPEHQANAHAGLIWEPFADAIMRLLNQKKTPVVFILWGSFARQKKKFLNPDFHHIIESAHPSPLSAYRGFFGSRPFSKTNTCLQEDGQTVINWLE